MIGPIIQIIQSVAWLFSLVLLVDVVVSYFLPPFNPIRAFLDRIVQPLLRPIQRIVPSFGGMDFSPLVLLILIQLVETILVNFLARIG
jgi:YggT family protein